MKRILEIDLDNQRICVEPGVTNARRVARPSGRTFFYPPDPSSQIVCSIGGNVAENSGGAHCFKYGFTTNYVTGLEVVLADGEMVSSAATSSTRPGYDLLGAFVGSEGTLGVATKVVAARRARRPRRSRRWSRSSTPRTRAGEAVSRDRAGRRRARARSR